MKKIIKYLYLKHLNVLIYSMKKQDVVLLDEINYTLNKEVISKNKTRFTIEENGVLVHESTLHNKLFFLRVVHKKGPAIGDCYTNELYRGKSIYPFVINKISKDLLLNDAVSEVFIIVDLDNYNSIKGIEKAGFKLFAKVDTYRFLFLYFKTRITR